MAVVGDELLSHIMPRVASSRLLLNAASHIRDDSKQLQPSQKRAVSHDISPQQASPISRAASDCTSTPSHPGTSARSANLKLISCGNSCLATLVRRLLGSCEAVLHGGSEELKKVARQRAARLRLALGFRAEKKQRCRGK